MDPKDAVLEEGFVENTKLWPKDLPTGISADTKKFYAHRRRFADGRVVWEFFQRGSGGGPNGEGDAVQETKTVTDDVVKKEFDEKQANAPTRVINGVPHERGPDGVYRPVLTAAGPAQAASAGKPVGSRTQVEGTPLPDGGFDNTRPVMVTRGPDGTLISSEPLTPAERQQWEREKNGGKTDAELASPAAKDAIGTPTGNTRQRTEGTTATKEVEYVLPDGTREWRSQTATEAPSAVDQVGKPTGNTRERTEGGAKIKETEYILPDGKREWRTQTAAGEPAGRKEEPYVNPGDKKQYTRVTETDPTTNQVRVYFVDPATGKEVTLPGDPLSNIKGVPSYTPDLTKPGAGLIDRAKQLDELLAAGTITYEQRQAILKNDQVLASSVANEFNVGVTLLREDYQNQTSQRNVDVQTSNTRASLANQHMQNALGLVSKFLPYMGQKPGTATNLFTGLLAAQVAHATALGGLKDIPREQMHPNLRSFAERTTAGAAGQTPAVPNVIGAGSVPASITPGAPEPPAALPAPIFRPQPEVTLPADARNPALEGALGLARPPQPEDTSQRAQAMNRQQVAMAQQLLGQGQEQPFQLAPLPEPTGTDFAPLPMVLDTNIPGLTPEIDAMAKRELDMALSGGRY